MEINNKLKAIYDAGKCEPTIRHIRFPHFKNLAPYLQLNFTTPITALVGSNGSNKSSVLRALACCPHHENIGDHWFSTDVDPIDETGGRPRYIFGYIDPTSKKTVEVIKARIKKANNPDYWEPSRPLIQDLMEKMPEIKSGQRIQGRSKTRWAGINKELEILDFRSEISAFDKLFYHGDMTGQLRNKNAKEHLRSRSKLLKRVIAENLQSLRPFKGTKETIFSNKDLPEDQLSEISKILGRKYDEIKLIKHNLFESNSYTAIMKTPSLQYSEAFAGSGEFAVVMLVHKIMDLKPNSLIVLDEPEVSLHPGAQTKLMEFLSNQCLIHKHQVFIGTHSKHIIERLQPESIILLQQDPVTQKIIAEQNIKPSEAFFHLGLIPEHKKRVFVEDQLAGAILKKCLRSLGEGAMKQFEIVVFPGGAPSIFGKCMTGLVQTGDLKSLFFLDGDQKRTKIIIHPNDIPAANHDLLREQITTLTNIKMLDFALDGGNDPQAGDKRKTLERDYLNYVLPRTFYLPRQNPEIFVWENMPPDTATKKCDRLPPKERFSLLTKIEKGLMDYEKVTSNEILETQIRKLALIEDSNPELSAITEILRRFVE
ncbi:ATP-dependent nuclease [Pseudomonas sp. BF-R-12]|uniref:ATP-dependent nuclease n=1 Tax=Pseudomonas sp. BF-R-12 TaxID=2832363 RepID=UPI001CBDF2A9|nr:ATP-binding protein [Pseudomonas sp. BF-R-12]